MFFNQIANIYRKRQKALLATSGRLDGIFGQDEVRHVARWQGIKTIVRVEEEDDDGVMTIREKEQFSHCLNLLFADGCTQVLTTDEPPKDDPAKGSVAAPGGDKEHQAGNGESHIEEA